METTTTTPAMSETETYTIDVSPERAAAWEDLQVSAASFERLERLGTHDEATLCRVIDLEHELRERIVASDSAVDGIQSFLCAASGFRDALDRYSVINLGELVENRRRRNGGRHALAKMKWPGWVDPDDPHRDKRILTDIESATVRYAALSSTNRNAALIGIGEAGATIDEATDITTLHLDTVRFTVSLGGNGRHVARTGSLPFWTHDSVIALVEPYRKVGDQFLERRALYAGTKPELRDIQKAVSMAALKVFETAGIGGRTSQVSFESVRRTTARRMHNAGNSIEQVAEFLGEKSLDRTRSKIGLVPEPAPYVRPSQRAA